jgi:hypothetical protein
MEKITFDELVDKEINSLIIAFETGELESMKVAVYSALQNAIFWSEKQKLNPSEKND